MGRPRPISQSAFPATRTRRSPQLGREQAARARPGAEARAGHGGRPSPVVSARLPAPHHHGNRARDAWACRADGFATDTRLQEIDLGVWDQLTDDEARALDPACSTQRGNDKWHVRVPGGENYAEVAARISDWVQDLKTDTFAISHGAATRILRGPVRGAGLAGHERPGRAAGRGFPRARHARWSCCPAPAARFPIREPRIGPSTASGGP